jgi:dTDP-4-amino-4,6-dideoxygalactose transaminase
MYAALPRAAAGETSMYAIKLALYGLLLRPRLYGIVHRMPGLGLGKTIYETRYPIARFSPTLAGLALRFGGRLDAINGVRIANARRTEAALQGAPGIRIPSRYPGAMPVFARFPLLVADETRRAALIANLNRAGIGATASYPQALIDVPEVARTLDRPADQRGAQLVARTIVTIPTHAYCPPDLGSRVRAIVDATLR